MTDNKNTQSNSETLVIKPEQVNSINQQDARIITTNNKLQPVDRGWKILKQAMVKDLPKLDVFKMITISIAKACADLM